MRQFSLIIIFAGLLPGCALTNPFSTPTADDQLSADQQPEHQLTQASPEENSKTEKSSSADAHADASDEVAVNQVESEYDPKQATTLPESQSTEHADDSAKQDVVANQATSGESTENQQAEPLQNTATTTTSVIEDVFESEEETTYPGVKIDMWDRIRSGFALEDRNHKRIEQQLKWYARHQEYLDRVAERAQPYMHHIVETLEANDVPLEIALLPIVESAFKPFAYSHGRASGIWQFIPATGKRYGLKQNWWYDGRRDVYASTDAAVRLLKALHKEFKGDWLLALAAYNSGSGNVRKAIRYNKKRGRSTDFFHLRLPKETKYYVPKLLALKKLIANPEKYNITLATFENKPYLAKVDVGSQIDLAVAAEMAEVELDMLYRLNPGFNRWATSPSGPHHLLVPLTKAEVFKKNLAEYPAEKRIRWTRHKIKQGETISTIAAKYNVSTSTIKRVNRLRSSRLRAGRSLTIPIASKKLSTYKLSANQRKRKQQNVPRSGTKVTHIVQQGDTLWELATRHKVGVRSLAKWNGMAPRDTLSVGQKIVIWSRNTGAQLDADITTTSHVSAPPRRNVTQKIGYRVRRGDSLARIARKFQVSVGQLLRWNTKVKKSNYLQPGQRIVLYVDVTQTSS